MLRSARVLRLVPIVVALLGACSAEEPPPPPEQPSASAEPARTATSERPLVSRSRPLMGTVYSIQVDAEPAVAEPAIQAAFAEIARLEQVLSEWIPESEISRANASAGGAPIAIGEDTLAVVSTGLEISRASEGAFDLSWAALRGLYEFHADSHTGTTPDARTLRERLRLVGYRDIQLDGSAKTLGLRRRGMQIGTGGIAKGYALDRAGALLEAAGVESYMIFGGGQVQVRGRRGNRAWRVGIQHPREASAFFAFLESNGGSISTSGDYEHYFLDPNGRRVHHIIDPSTGLPANRAMSVTIISPKGIYADALSTAVFVLGPERGLAMLAALPFSVEAVIVGNDCRLHATPGTRERLTFRMELEDGVLPVCVGRP